MRVKSKTLIVLLVLILSIALSMICVVFGGAVVKKIGMAEVDRGHLPIRRLKIKVDMSQREVLFEQCRKFADKHQFQYDLSFYESSGGKNFQVWMRGYDIEIIVRDVPESSMDAVVNIYNTNPSLPAPSETVDELLNDLKIFLGEIPNITITEEQ